MSGPVPSPSMIGLTGTFRTPLAMLILAPPAGGVDADSVIEFSWGGTAPRAEAGFAAKAVVYCRAFAPINEATTRRPCARPQISYGDGPRCNAGSIAGGLRDSFARSHTPNPEHRHGSDRRLP